MTLGRGRPDAAVETCGPARLNATVAHRVISIDAPAEHRGVKRSRFVGILYEHLPVHDGSSHYVTLQRPGVSICNRPRRSRRCRVTLTSSVLSPRRAAIQRTSALN